MKTEQEVRQSLGITDTSHTVTWMDLKGEVRTSTVLADNQRGAEFHVAYIYKDFVKIIK